MRWPLVWDEVIPQGSVFRPERFEAERAVAHVRELGSRRMQGRLMGSDGEHRAAQYLVSALRVAGLRPIESDASFVDPFEAVVAELIDTPLLRVGDERRAQRFEHLVDFGVNVQGRAGGGAIVAESVWLGSFEASDGGDEMAAGRVVVCGGLPGVDRGDLAAALQAYLERLRRAHRAGARAVLQVAARTDRRKVMNHLRERPGLPCLDVSERVVRALFGSLPDASPRLGALVELRVPLCDRRVSSAGNVVGRLGDGPVRLVLAAHYDHVGALPDGRWFSGAADNASGVAIVLETARALAAEPPPGGEGAVILLTTGEEIGMLGARRFAAGAARALREDAIVVHVDEVAGSADDPLWLLRSAGFPETVVGAEDGQAMGAPLRLAALSKAGFTDHVPFLEEGFRRVGLLFGRGASDLAHTLHDRPERIPAERLAVGGQLLLLMAQRALAQHQRA